MEIKEDDPSNHITQNELENYFEYSLDLQRHWYYYSQFSNHYYRVQCSVEFNDFVPCKSLELFNNRESQVHRKNLEIVIVQVNTAELNITNLRNGNNYLSTVSPYYTYCIDIKRLLTLKKFRFHIKEYMHKENVPLSQQSKFCISVSNEQNLKQSSENISNLFYYRKKQCLCNEESIRLYLKPRETCLLSNGIQENRADSGLARQGIDFRISLWKYTLPQLFYTLLQMCDSRFRLTLNPATVSIFSVTVGYWYFQNISQGYLLKLLLSNVNDSTLSIMMQLYFILITHVNPNLTIQINYRRKPELLAIHESLFINTFSFKSVEWCEDHRIVLKSKMFHFPNVYNEEPFSLKLLRAIQYANTDSSQNESLIQVVDYEAQTQCEPGDETEAPASHEHLGSMVLALSLTEDDKKTIPSESESETKVNILSLPQSPPTPPTPYKKYSDIFRLDNVANYNETSWTSSTENLTFLHKETEELKKSDIKLLNVLFSCGVTNFSLMQGKLWGAELRQKFNALKMYINLHDVFDAHNMINESMFEGTSVNLYETYCKPILNQKFVGLTLINLGKSLGNILFNMK